MSVDPVLNGTRQSDHLCKSLNEYRGVVPVSLVVLPARRLGQMVPMGHPASKQQHAGRRSTDPTKVAHRVCQSVESNAFWKSRLTPFG